MAFLPFFTGKSATVDMEGLKKAAGMGSQIL
jgi:hypothetical protein